MDFRFDCDCGETIEDFTRGGPDASLLVECEVCQSVYAITITPIEAGGSFGSN